MTATPTATVVTSAAATSTGTNVQPSNTPNGCAMNTSSTACLAPMMSDDETSKDLVYYQSGLMEPNIHLTLKKHT